MKNKIEKSKNDFDLFYKNLVLLSEARQDEVNKKEKAVLLDKLNKLTKDKPIILENSSRCL